MKITSLELREIRAELPIKFSGGTYSLNHRASLLCRIGTDSGIVGEVCVGNESSYGDTMKQLIRGPIRKMLLGQDPMCITRLWMRMFELDKAYVDRVAVVNGIATVDTALWDLKGKITGQPIWKLMGGNNPVTPMIGIGGYYETSRHEAGIRDEIAMYKDIGLAGIKFKVGAIALEEDAERVRIARDAAGPDFAIVVDSNQAWTPYDSVRFAAMIAPIGPAWLEEPVYPRNVVRGLHEVRMKSGLKIGAGQSEPSVFDCYRLLSSEAVDVINMTYNRGGGITAWLKMANAASLVDIAMGQVGEPHIGMHLMAGVSNGTYAECYPDKSRDPFWHDLYLDRPPLVDGCITAPEKPGVGLTFNPDSVERYAIEPWS